MPTTAEIEQHNLPEGNRQLPQTTKIMGNRRTGNNNNNNNYLSADENPNQETSFSMRKAFMYGLPSGLTLVVCTTIYALYHERIGIRVPHFETPTERLSYTLKLTFFPAATLTAAIHWVWLHRVWYPQSRNPLVGPRSEAVVDRAARILQNTLEQTVLFVLNILVFTVVAPDEHLFMLPYLVFCFTAGRVAFGVGYTIDAICRIPGFLWTFLPSMAVFWYNCGKIFHWF
ncbi:hypothetical protein TYRP_005358 [Tyrophagus putrescentiae]|nr:hypothetical protein TYRP_005358 [Tyrophagus putrescentiae]